MSTQREHHRRTLVEESQLLTEPPAVSYVVPTYNRAQWAARAVSSVVASSRASRDAVEIVITDDSTTKQVIESVLPILRGSGCSFRLYANSPSAGMAANWNLGILGARGRYVAFVHDDDFVTENAVADHSSAIRRVPKPVYLFGVRVVDSRERLARRRKAHSAGSYAPREAILMLLNDSSLIRFPGILATRRAYLDAGGFDSTLGGPADVDMWLRLFAHHGLHICSETTAAYTVHSGALTEGMFNVFTIESVAKVFERVPAEIGLTAVELERARANFLTQFILGGARRALVNGMRAEARSILRLRDTAALTRPARPWLEMAYRTLRATL